MSYEAEHNALRARFEAEWGVTTPIAWMNANFKPTDDAAYVRFIIINADAKQVCFGDAINLYRFPGMVMVQIFTPISKGDKEALQLADQAANIFRNWSDVSTGIRFLVPPTAKTIGTERNWHQVNVLTPYTRDTLF